MDEWKEGKSWREDHSKQVMIRAWAQEEHQRGPLCWVRRACQEPQGLLEFLPVPLEAFPQELLEVRQKDPMPSQERLRVPQERAPGRHRRDLMPSQERRLRVPQEP